MREPVIEDNAADHAQFCKYAADLLERVTGKSLATSSAVPSLSRITKVTWSQLPLYPFTPLWRRWFVIHSGSPDQNEKKSENCDAHSFISVSRRARETNRIYLLISVLQRADGEVGKTRSVSVWILLRFSVIGIEYNEAESNCGIARVLGILLKNGFNRYVGPTIALSLFPSNYSPVAF